MINSKELTFTNSNLHSCKFCMHPDRKQMEDAIISKLMTRKDVCKILNISTGTCTNHMHKHLIPPMDIIGLPGLLLTYERLKRIVEIDLSSLDLLNKEVLDLLNNSSAEDRIKYMSGLSTVIEQRRKYVETAMRFIDKLDKSNLNPSAYKTLTIKYIESLESDG